MYFIQNKMSSWLKIQRVNYSVKKIVLRQNFAEASEGTAQKCKANENLSLTRNPNPKKK